MAERIRVRGTQIDRSDKVATEIAALGRDGGLQLELRGAASILSAGRTGGKPVDLEVNEGDVLEYRDREGWIEWTTVRSLRERARRRRGVDVAGTIDLQEVLGPDPRTRGARDLSEVRAFQVKIPDGIREQLDILERFQDRLLTAAARPIVREAATAVVKWIERPVADDAEEREDKAKVPGVYHIGVDLRLAGSDRLRDGETLVESPEPQLVLVHGTFSNTEAAFGGLRGTSEWNDIFERYDGRAVALEHPTLSVSPAVNALELARHLPANAKVHLVSHSRGGLVGELLSLASPGPDRSPAALDPARFSRAEPDLAVEERKVFEQLVREMTDRNARVERFVRVACPAAGTILASQRLDTYAGALFNIISNLSGSTGWPLVILKTLVLTFLEQRTDPSVIPGLEAQMPESPYIHLVNSTPRPINDGLAAIVGDVEPGRWLSWLAVKAADLFYREDHDFVVDTRSMYNGAPRQNAVVSFHYGKDVNHFTYFREGAPRNQMKAWLLKEEDEEVPAGFEDLDRSVPKLAKIKHGRAADADMPTVIVIPAFMGNALLDLEGGEVWPSVTRLATEGLGLIGKRAALQPGSLLEHTYQALLDRLGQEFRVVPFAFDWRNSIADIVPQLVSVVEAELEATSAFHQPVHLVAHSTGGAVACLLQTGTTWEKLRLRGGRLLLLGSTDRGTFRSLQLATGHADINHRFRLLDPKRSVAQVARLFRSYPWVLETLPRDGEWWSASWWLEAGVKWAPKQEALDEARGVIASTEELRGDGVIPVFGFARTTPRAVTVADSTVAFEGSGDGDGVIAAGSAARLSGTTYFVPGSHGELPSHPGSLDGYVDLLRSGHTHHLLTDPGEVSDGGLPIPDAARSQLFPGARDLELAAVGWDERSAAAPTDDFAIHVEVVHGSLAFADYPVMVGHYDGSTIEGAEGALDYYLDYRLTARDLLDVYPGPIGTAEVIAADPNGKPPGAIIVGMGEVGALNAAKVTRSVTEGALRQAMAVLDQTAADGGTDDATEVERETAMPLSVGVATVLIGTAGLSGLTIESSVAAIVKGMVAANRHLDERGLIDRVRIEQVQIMEMYEDVAIEAARTVADLQSDIQRTGARQLGRIEVASHLRLTEGGRPGQPKPEYRDGEWRPLVVESVRTCIDAPPLQEGEEAPGVRVREDLTFKSIGHLARAEEVVNSSQRELLHRLIDQAIGRTRPPEQVYNTLYELLLPNFLKGQTRESENLLLVLDSNATRYPWEMLAVRTPDGLIEPLSVQTGMLRRLLTHHFRRNPNRSAGTKALVIGDPPAGPGLPRLEGARLEAEKVRFQLSSNGFDVRALISQDPNEAAIATDMDIVNALFADEYRILHIASHGHYDQQDPERSGAVIGENSFLTALVLRQLQTVPQLVFLNCCHLAKVDLDNRLDIPRGPEGASWLHGRFHDFAASVSEQLIRDGVRSVVAAGWVVDDAAAAEFANAFYEMMLDGHPFGDAVRLARQRIFEMFPMVNTWGAYQCYGDSGFKLVHKRPDDTKKRRLVARTELINRLRKLESDAQHPDADGPGLAAQVESLLSATPREWHEGEVHFLAGEVLKELGRFGEAIEYYERALNGWSAEAPIRILEQLANVSIRHAAEMAREEKPNRDRIRQLEERAEGLLHQLIEIVPTPERHSLLGSFHRKRALLGYRRAASIKRAEKHYGAARLMYAERGQTDPYSAINWGVFRFLRGDLTTDSADFALIQEVACESIEEAKRRERTKPEFWNRVAEPDAELMLGLAHRDLDRRAPRIARMYESAFGVLSTERERRSVFDHLESLETMLRWRKETRLADAAADMAARLHEETTES